MTLAEIKELLPELKKSNVSEFNQDEHGVLIKFHVEPYGQPVAEAIKKMEDKVNESLPPDLRTDKITDMDNILNWSAGPSHESTGMTGTDDLPLTMGVPLESSPRDPIG